MATQTTTALTLSVAALLFAAAASAQPGQLQRSEPAAPETRRYVDGVIGIFGDKAILESSIRSELQAQIEGARNAGRQLMPGDITALRNDILRQLVRREALAQGARTMRGTTRQQVDQMVNQYVQAFRREEEERAGSVNRLTEDLGILGQTWESLAEERRTELMAGLAHQENLRRRYQDSFALAVTPAEMRTFYQTNLDLFVQQRSCDLEVVTISGGDSTAHAQAVKLAESWRADPRPAAQVAKDFGGFELAPRMGVSPTADDGNAPFIKEFAAKAKQGDVSAPIQQGNSFWVLRAQLVNPGRHDTFDDPTVQAWIQNRLVEARIAADKEKLILQERAKLQFIRTKGTSR